MPLYQADERKPLPRGRSRSPRYRSNPKQRTLISWKDRDMLRDAPREVDKRRYDSPRGYTPAARLRKSPDSEVSTGSSRSHSR